MLLNRSIIFQVCLLFLTAQCQDYESSYESDANDESDHPDYSKYFSVDTSAPLVQGGEGGFASPIEFAGFFGPDFGESGKQEVKQPKNPFVQQPKSAGFVGSADFNFFAGDSQSHYPRDYFEEAQQQQNAESESNDDSSYQIPPGPNYISHQLPKIKEVADYSHEVEHIKPKSTKNNKYRKNEKYDKDYQEAADEGDKYKSPDYSFDSSKYTDYETGKSSSTVSQKPNSYLKSTPTPYQKYSFQPVTESFHVKSKYLDDLISTVAPFNPAYDKIVPTSANLNFEGAHSEAIPSHLRGKNCQRIQKHVENTDFETGELKQEPMNCFVCKDAKTSGESTHCSYVQETEPKNDFSGSSIRYSTPSKDNEDGFRYKRYSGDDYSVDPYSYVRGRSRKAQKEAEDTKQYDEYKVPDDFYNFDYDKSYSESQSEQIQQNPANCVKEEKSGMTCTVCKDPKTGGNFEQCSYTSAPKEQKYAYVAEKKYDSNDDPADESKTAPQTTRTASNSSSLSDPIPEQVIKDYIKKKVPTVIDYKVEPTYKEFSSKKVSRVDDKKLNKKEPRYDESKNKYTRFEDYDDTATQKPKSDKLTNYNNHRNKYSSLVNYKPAEQYGKLEQFPEERGQSQNNERFEYDNAEYDNAKEYVTGAPAKASNKPQKLVDDDPYEIPKHFAESTIKERQTDTKDVDSSLYGHEDSAEAQEEEEEGAAEEGEAEGEGEADPYKDIAEYHFKLFPEFNNEESQQAEVVANPESDPSRKDVEEVLAEFSKKDRSACKKASKNGMTCYLCVDAKGIQHEECMYVSESKPQASHVAYHEVKQIKSPENNTNNQNTEQLPAATEIDKRKHFFKKVATTTTSAPFTLDEAASEEIETKIRYNKKPTKSRKQKKAASRTSYTRENEPQYDPSEPTQKTPVEFEVGEKEGAFSAETKPVYSKVLGVRLPKYMVEKSAFEKEFDEFAGTF